MPGQQVFLHHLNPKPAWYCTEMGWGAGEGVRGDCTISPPNHPCSFLPLGTRSGKTPPVRIFAPALDIGSSLWNNVHQRPAAEEGVPGKATLQGVTVK